MEVERICQWCGKPFIAHTMVSSDKSIVFPSYTYSIYTDRSE